MQFRNRNESPRTRGTLDQTRDTHGEAQFRSCCPSQVLLIRLPRRLRRLAVTMRAPKDGIGLFENGKSIDRPR